MIINCLLQFADEEKDHDFDRLMNEYIGQLGLNITAEKIIHVRSFLVRRFDNRCLRDLFLLLCVKVQEKNRKWIMDCSLAQEEGTKRPPKVRKRVILHAVSPPLLQCAAKDSY